MTPPDDLFPFPASPTEEDDERKSPVVLPPFFEPPGGQNAATGGGEVAPKPGEGPFPQGHSTATQPVDVDVPPLTRGEITAIRRFLALLSSGPTTPAGEKPSSPVPRPDAAPPARETPGTEQSNSNSTRKMLLEMWNSLPTQPGAEAKACVEIGAILGDIPESSDWYRVFMALAGVCPIRESIRHGTPEQRVFTLTALGDRFLQGISGLAFQHRKPLIKAVGRFFSGIAEGYSFLSAEQDSFDNQFHERVEGASPNGRLIREMRGFLVVRSAGNQVVRSGRVLT